MYSYMPYMVQNVPILNFKKVSISKLHRLKKDDFQFL